MKNRYIAALLILSFSLMTSSAFAANKLANAICPKSNAFKNIGFDEIQKGDHPGVWTLIQNNNYNTSRNWQFSLMIDADTKDAAIKKAKQALANLRKLRGPEKVDTVWVCDYQSKNALSAVAISKE